MERGKGLSEPASREGNAPGPGAGGAVAPVLAVDLDGTLIRTDLLPESFLAALGARPGAALAALGALPQGKAAFKARLADIAAGAIDAAHLPYDPAVLDLVRRARAEGRRTVLVSASDRRLVQAVADHLGLFDEAHGSDGARNLGGRAKAEFLADRFGRGGYDYAGDARADLPVWAGARRAITVGAGRGLAAAADRLAGPQGPQVAHLAPPPGPAGRLRPYLRAMRPHQWLKNALLLLPVLAAHATEAGPWAAALLGALAFSLTASSVYLLNDLLDLGPDRLHPRKSRRPFAAGTAQAVPGALLGAGLLALAALIAALALPPAFAAVLGVYYLCTLAYSLGLKRRLMIDIVVLAGLYTLRVVAGGAASGIPLSPWLLAFSGFLFLALAAMKRQAELVDGQRRGRAQAAGRAYRTEDLPVVTAMAAAAGQIAVLVLALYINSPGVQALYSSPLALWAACPVLLYWLGRLVLLTQRGQMTDDPLVFALRDRISLGCGGLVAALAVAGSVL